MTLVPGRTTSIQNDVVISLDRDMPLSASPFLGMRFQPLSYLGVAFVYRGAAISHAGGPQTTTAGPIVANSPVDYLIFWDPAQLVLGASVGPFKGLSVSVDATYSEWSAYRTAFDQPLTPSFADTVSIMGGVEWDTLKWLTLRAGGGYEPSPLPPQSGDTNYLGADTIVLALGGGVDLRRLCRAPLLVDFHVRGRFGTEQTATKSPGLLSDADPNTPGQQIDNVGFPGFQSQSSLYQAGLTLTLFVGKDKEMSAGLRRGVRRALIAAAAGAALSVPRAASAGIEDTFALGPGPMALGGSYAARPGDFASAYYNPAGIAPGGSVVEKGGFFEGSFALIYGHPSLFVARPNGQNIATPATDDTAGALLGARFSVGQPFHLDGLDMGLAVYLPGHVFEWTIRPDDTPQWALFTDRTQVLSANLALAYRVLRWLSVGAGVRVTFDTETNITGVLTHFNTANDQATAQIGTTPRCTDASLLPPDSSSRRWMASASASPTAVESSSTTGAARLSPPATRSASATSDTTSISRTTSSRPS